MNTITAGYRERIHWLHVAPLVFYFLLSPFYMFDSGMPQIADGILIVGILGMLLGLWGEADIKIRAVFFIGLTFAVYTVFINMINYLYFPHTRFILSSLFYPYNMLVFIYTVRMLEKYGAALYKIIFATVVVAVIGQFFWAVLVPQDHWREIGSFNNPNQLAYWSLLTATMIVFLRQDQKVGLLEFGLILVLGVLQVLALSKVGLISYFVFLIILFFSPYIKRTASIFMVLAALTAISLGALLFNQSNLSTLIFERPLERLANIGDEPDDSAEARGYTRPLEFPSYVLFGAGEGAYDRFEPSNPVELHSGIMTILFSYGISGFLLFGAFLMQVANKKSIYILLFFVPVLMVGLTGQSFRFSHFWIFLAFAYLSNMPRSSAYMTKP